MFLPAVKKETMEGMMAEIGLNDDKLKEAVKIMKEWLKQQPHLPSEIDDGRLERWIFASKNSLERTKDALDMYFSLKNIVPEFLTDRDTTGSWFKNANSVILHVPLPTLTPEYNRVIICQLADHNMSKFNTTEVCKLVVSVQDVRKNEDFYLSDIFIIDMENYNTGFLTKLSIPVTKKGMVCLKKCFESRIHSIHFINVTSYMDIILAVLKSIFNPKVMGRIHVHTNGLETLYEHLPKTILPTEYGGEAGPFLELHSSWKKHLESNRDWLLDQDKYKCDETKRVGKKINDGDIFGFEGSFRQLSVD